MESKVQTIKGSIGGVHDGPITRDDETGAGGSPWEEVLCMLSELEICKASSFRIKGEKNEHHVKEL